MQRTNTYFRFANEIKSILKFIWDNVRTLFNMQNQFKCDKQRYYTVCMFGKTKKKQQQRDRNQPSNIKECIKTLYGMLNTIVKKCTVIYFVNYRWSSCCRKFLIGMMRFAFFYGWSVLPNVCVSLSSIACFVVVCVYWKWSAMFPPSSLLYCIICVCKCIHCVVYVAVACAFNVCPVCPLKRGNFIPVWWESKRETVWEKFTKWNWIDRKPLMFTKIFGCFCTLRFPDSRLSLSVRLLPVLPVREAVTTLQGKNIFHTG